MQPVTTTKMKVTKVRCKPKTISVADLNVCAMLPGGCHLGDQLTALFDAHHAKRCGPINSEIRSMGGSAATSFFKSFQTFVHIYSSGLGIRFTV